VSITEEEENIELLGRDLGLLIVPHYGGKEYPHPDCDIMNSDKLYTSGGSRHCADNQTFTIYDTGLPES
jgi:hypothetical protein